MALAFDMFGGAFSASESLFPSNLCQSTLEVLRKVMDVLASKGLLVEDRFMWSFYSRLLDSLHLILTNIKCPVYDHVSSFIATLKMFFCLDLRLLLSSLVLMLFTRISSQMSNLE